MIEEAVSSYEVALTGEAEEWLGRRGIDPLTASTFRLGSVTDPHPGHGRLRGWLSIPYLDKQGKALTVRFRCLKNHTHSEHGHNGKYMTLTGDTARMYNIRAVHEADEDIHVTEGELDAVILTMLGLSAVSIPGAQNWQFHHGIMLAGFNRVWVWADPDDAGADLTRKITKALRQAKLVRLREGDVNDTYLAHGEGRLRELLEAA